MSRSRKAPYHTDQQTWAKRTANKKVRQSNKKSVKVVKEELADGKAYRKKYCSWNIRDWSFEQTKDDKRRGIK